MALAEIKNRRNMAKAENDLHFQEIDKNIPEIAEINSQLARTGMNIVAIMKSGENVDEKLQELKDRNQEAQFLIKRLLVENGYPEDYLAIKYSCDICFDTGFVNGRRCRCLENLIAKMTAKEMNKNSQINLCSFDTFDINLYRGTDMMDTERKRNRMRNTYQQCKKYAEEFNPLLSENILMFGRTGLGKTHLSLAIANEVLKKGYGVLYDSALNYLNKIEKEHFGKASDDSDTLGQLLSADLLILDDLGTEYTKPFYISTIYNIINTRINKGLPTIISTNLNHEEMLKKYDERIISRLFATYESYEFVGEDIRLIKREMKK
ncbi:MAG: ATP-binding protein [Oscillospiraceae bacterium]|nr:ATP-binding protein [Oscillospiraceae bacterium]